MSAPGARFRDLHGDDEAFIMPNPWDVGSAKLLASLGYRALGTTSAGLAHSLGRSDGVRVVSRDEALAHARAIVEATDLPVSADLERGFGDTPDEVAATIVAAAERGLAGCSIEDATGLADDPIYDLGLATERIVAAVEAVRSLDDPFVLTARSENFLHDRPDLADTIARLEGFQDAGAEVLYAPGLPDLEAMQSVVSAVDRPVNLLVHPRYTIAELQSTGAKRISLGSAFSRAAWGGFIRAAREVIEEGSLGFMADSADFDDLDELFSGS